MKLRVIDFETTGFKPPAAQVIEYGFCDLDHDGQGWNVLRPVARLCGVTEVPAEVRAVHHIRASDVAGLEPFDPGEPILDANAHGVLALVAHNWEFEAQFLGDHALPVLCTLKAASRVWPDAPRHTNGVLRYWLEDQGLLSLDDDLASPPPSGRAGRLRHRPYPEGPAGHRRDRQGYGRLDPRASSPSRLPDRQVPRQAMAGGRCRLPELDARPGEHGSRPQVERPARAGSAGRLP